MDILKKQLSLLLVLMLVFTMMPGSVFATEALAEAAEPFVLWDSSVNGEWGNGVAQKGTLDTLTVSGVSVVNYEWVDGVGVVTLSKDTPVDATMKFASTGREIVGMSTKTSLYLNKSNSVDTVQLVNGAASVEVRVASKFQYSGNYTEKFFSFAIEEDSSEGELPEGVPFSAITTDAGAAISVREEGEATLYAWGTEEHAASLYRVVIPKDATCVNVKMNVPQGQLVPYTDGSIAGYAGNNGETGYGVGFEMISADESTTTIQIPVVMEVYDWMDNATYDYDLTDGAIAGPEYDDFSAICYFTFEYGEGGSAEEPACDHKDTETTTSYVQNVGSETHLVIVTCQCGGIVSTADEACVDADKSGACDGCSRVMAVPCDHTNTTTTYAQVGGTETHTVTVTCECSEVISQTTVDCVDADGDLKCDNCEGAVACQHVKKTPDYDWAAKGDGTHDYTVTYTCDSCGEVFPSESVNQPCEDEDRDGECDRCYGAVEVPAAIVVTVDGAAIELAEAMHESGYILFHGSYPMGKEAVVTTGDGGVIYMQTLAEQQVIEGSAITNAFAEEFAMTANDFNSYGFGVEIGKSSKGLALMAADENGNMYMLVLELTADEEPEQPDEPAVPITEINFWAGDSEPITEITVNIDDVVDAIACCTPKKTDENVVVFSSGNPEIFIVENEEVTADEYGHARVTIKGVKMGSATLTATSKTNHEVTAELTVIVPCNHVGTETTSKGVYEPVGNEMHNGTVTKYCACGEKLSTSTVLNEACVDADKNGKCDKCQGEVEVPVVIYDSSVHGVWGSPITMRKLSIKGVSVKKVEWINGACLVTLADETPDDAAITFVPEGIGGYNNMGAFYVECSTNYTVNLVNGGGTFEVRLAHKNGIVDTVAEPKNITFIRESVEIVPVESIVITPENGRLVANGGTLRLTATVYPENATIKDVAWTTNADSTAMTLTEEGVCIGGTMGCGGTYNVTATSKSDPNVKATVKVFLDWKKEDSIVLSKESMTVKIGEPSTLIATVEGTAFVTNTSVSWTSSDESIATVDSGKVTGLKTGTATITATSYYGLTATCEVTVICGHVGVGTVVEYQPIEGTEKHTVITNCSCGNYVLGSTTENCVDEDANGKCDKCEGAVKVETDVMMGDLTGEGDVNGRDAVLILQYAAATYQLTEAQMIAADVNNDGEINGRDAVLILQSVAE